MEVAPGSKLGRARFMPGRRPRHLRWPAMKARLRWRMWPPLARVVKGKHRLGLLLRTGRRRSPVGSWSMLGMSGLHTPRLRRMVGGKLSTAVSSGVEWPVHRRHLPLIARYRQT
jgi:hypothetical protein